MEDFVLKARKGNRDAFLKLLDSRLGILYKIAYTYFKNKDEASDAVQDAVLIAYKNINSLKDDAKFNSWITTILVNRCRDILRRSKKIRFEEYTDAAVNADYPGADDYGKVDANVDIFNSLQEIDEIYRDVITLKYLGDYSINEISKIFGIPEGTVKSRLNAGLKKLRNIMEVGSDGVHSCIRKTL